MDRIEIIESLSKLADISAQYETALNEYREAKQNMRLAEEYTPNRVVTFDAQNKSKYVYEQIGDGPKKLGKWNPLKLSKKKRDAVYAARKAYFKNKAETEKQYYIVYENKRNELKKEDDEDKAGRILDAQNNLQNSEKIFQSAKNLWEQDTLLSERLRNENTIRKMLMFFEDGRVDSMKEAVNLYFEETWKDEEARLAAEHRAKIESTLEEQNKTIEELIDKIDDISSDADEALRLAQQAIDRADEAYTHADEVRTGSNVY